MADSFEKWMERLIKQNQKKGTANNCEELNNIWTALQSEALKDYERRRLSDGSVTIATRIENSERIRITTNKEGAINLFLSDRFFMQFLAIKKHFTEYYTLFGLFDRPYFKRLINDFRKHFPPDHRVPGIKYFDDLIIEFTAEYNTGEFVKMPLKFADFLNHDDPEQLINKLKQKFPTGQNKEAAIMVTALESAGLLFEIENETDLISAIKKEWNTDFVYESYMKPRRKIRQRRIDKKSDTAELIEATKFVIGCK